CHSYKTKMPWYGHISPIALEVKSHIKEGRKAVNFQEWNRYDENKKQKVYKGIVKTINFRMPIPMYLIIHEDARLTKSQRDAIKIWAKDHILKENH
ncbi:MAG: heme-binding domain-containing protein, partial [Sulfurovum sp.]|nr:heme-binding domain-containing protein [Sulfurovum sp.]